MTPTRQLFQVAAINAILGRWGRTASAWNISGEPCTGTALDSGDIVNPNVNPGLKCVCSDDNATTCHITQL
ncbi:hypothetical protein GW17_00026020 [Ensete ventricosum]|nr:hypothetical protein GW17_00026020 [Ensete ventricosum]RZS00825.1 hypothetical protein BHM03_00030598 [Ensete ventricosum]